VLEALPIGYGVDVGAGVLDDNDDAAGVLPPLVAEADADVSPTLPSAVVDSAPAVLEALPIGYGVDVGAGVLDDNDDAAGVLLAKDVVLRAGVAPELFPCRSSASERRSRRQRKREANDTRCDDLTGNMEGTRVEKPCVGAHFVGSTASPIPTCW